MTLAAHMLTGNAAAHPMKGKNVLQANTHKDIFSKILSHMQKDETTNSGEEMNELTANELDKLKHQMRELLHGTENISLENSVKQITSTLEELQGWVNQPESDTMLNEQLLQELQLVLKELKQKINSHDTPVRLETNPENHVISNLQKLNFSSKRLISGNGIDTGILVKQTEKIINKLSTDMRNNDYKHLLRILAQWSRLPESQQSVINSLLGKSASNNEMHVFQTMLTNFQNKENMQMKYGYANKVTQKDIQSWLMKALEKNETAKRETTLGKNSLSPSFGQPVDSKIQQFVIHLQQTNNEVTQMQKQLMDQLQQIMAKSNFMRLANGTNQLTIRLQPEYLGDIGVKLTQINGEMIVKMLVQSQGAKELLEGNLTQLRHLFSPQQVTIEKIDNLQASHPDTATEKNQEEADEDNQQSRDQQEEEHPDEEKVNFRELLMDAKV